MRAGLLMLTALLCGVGGCGDDEGGDDDDTPAVDAAVDELDAPAPGADGGGADAETFAGVTCGFDMSCAVGDGCCADELPPACASASGGVCGPGDRHFQCDGPEDCDSATEDCCYEPMSGAMCLPKGCATGLVRYVMCHAEADCAGVGGPCCGLSGGPQADLYGACTGGPCPQ